MSSDAKETRVSKSKKQLEKSIQKIHDNFETIKFSTFFLVVDPILETLCYPIKMCYGDKFCYKRSRMLKKAEDKY